ncbi:MAG: Mov34/MPN/PAD-1 family protein, partial [Planctomycetales bacterium]|nr:Mov34/MPN/PAD-1 family protein [Planctomycetales bacterium]
LVEEVELVRQLCSVVTVAFDDESVADFYDRQTDAGRQPQEFSRIWIHTHPGACARPSQTDEQTFRRVFGGSDWAVMFILAQEGQTYARLRFNAGPGGSIEIPVEIDYAVTFRGCDHTAWEQEYLENVSTAIETAPPWPQPVQVADAEDPPLAWREAWHDYSDQEFEEMFAHERWR